VFSDHAFLLLRVQKQGHKQYFISLGNRRQEYDKEIYPWYKFTMGIIKQLPEEIAIKIAAGEVVERPASVVKELVENAIDAGASSVEITLQDGGKTGIEIKDKGSGMDSEDAQKAFLRHGTSKIRSIEDLDHVATLGFRGEALAAIGASGEVELVTALHNASEGTKVVVRNGEITSARPHAPISGTTITVTNLFASLPARQKFLKSEATEWRACLEVIMKQMISHPEVGFILKHNTRTVFDVPSGQELPSRVAETWKIEQSKLIEIISEVPHIALYGVVAKPEVAHIGKARQFLSVNGHPIFDKLIARAVRDAFGTLLPPNMQPSFALNLTLHPGMVDVNIHPRKDEVRFINGQEIFRFVLHSISQVLEKHNLAFQTIPDTFTPTRRDLPQDIQETSHFNPILNEPAPNRSIFNSSPQAVPTASRSTSAPRHASLSHIPTSSLMEIQAPIALPTPILTLDACYLITISNGKLLLVDQHAAHERILYNKLWQQDATNQTTRQALLLPSELQLSEEERARFGEYKSEFESLGFAFSRGEAGIYLLEVPHFLKRVDPITYFHDVFKGVQEGRTEPELTSIKHKLFATMACKAAVKAGDTISDTEKRQLIDDLLGIDNNIDEEAGSRLASNGAGQGLASANMGLSSAPNGAGFTCPHGRPSHIEIAPSELEKLFKRTGF
jgi:DNA mismatch repair protein MutL